MFKSGLFALGLVLSVCVVVYGLGDPICPPTNQSGESSYYARNADCNKYYKCVDGVREDLTCPMNQYFSFESETCEYLTVVNCKPALIVCPFGNKIVYHAHAGDCRKYYLCYSGISIEYKCPHDKIFDKDKKVCLPEEQATCGKY